MFVRLLELIRFSHTLFALPFALLAAAMAWSANFRAEPPVPFRWLDLLGILVCMATARSAAMAFNRLADRRLDALNPRTRMRHLPTGLLSTGSVVVFTVLCSLGFVAGTLLFLPQQSVAAVRFAARAGLSVRLQLCQAVHGAVAFLAGGGVGAGPGGGVGGDSRGSGLAAGGAGGGRGALGGRAST